jgi:hypothetical protein
MARRGKGTIYKREATENWWLDYYDAQGKRLRRSAGTADENLAQKRLEEAMAAVARDCERSDLSFKHADDREHREHDLSLADQVARLGNEVAALKQRLAYYELLWPHRRDSVGDAPRGHNDARKLAYIREILAHCIAAIDRAG